MKVLILGATGNIGRKAVEYATASEHEVTAFARTPMKLERESWFDARRTRLLAGDIKSAADVQSAVAGHEAVIWTVGAPLNRQTLLHPPDVCSVGTQHVVDAMDMHQVSRLVCLTAIGLGDSKGSGRWIFRSVIQPLMLGRIYADREHQERIVMGSEQDWTIVRPAELTDKPLGGKLRAMTAPYQDASFVERASVARFMVDEAASRAFSRQTVLLTQ